MKPLTIPLLRALGKYVRAPDSETGRAGLLTFAVEQLVQRPVLFKDRFGLEYLLYPSQSPGVYFESNGNYEIEESAFCTRFVQPGMTAFDVGANIGIYTLLLAKLVGESGQVHAFEAESLNYGRLAQNVALNQLTHVHIWHQAVYSETGMINLNVYPERFTAWHTIGTPQLPDPDNPSEIVRPTHTERVEAVTLDEHCVRESVDEIDLLKVDVEGAELDVLQGASSLLEGKKIRCILFEASGPQVAGMGHTSEEVFDFVRASSFTVFSLHEGQLHFESGSGMGGYENFVALRDEADHRRMNVQDGLGSTLPRLGEGG